MVPVRTVQRLVWRGKGLFVRTALAQSRALRGCVVTGVTLRRVKVH